MANSPAHSKHRGFAWFGPARDKSRNRCHVVRFKSVRDAKSERAQQKKKGLRFDNRSPVSILNDGKRVSCHRTF